MDGGGAAPCAKLAMTVAATTRANVNFAAQCIVVYHLSKQKSMNVNLVKHDGIDSELLATAATS